MAKKRVTGTRTPWDGGRLSLHLQPYEYRWLLFH